MRANGTRRVVAAVLCTGILSTVGIVASGGSSGSAAEPGAPAGQDFVITPADLDFVVRQIDIAEAHARKIAAGDANASPLCSQHARFDDGLHVQTWFEPNGDPCVGSALLPHGLRTVDGRWNNLLEGQIEFGASRQIFPRLLEPEFRDADPIPPGGAPGGPAGTPTSYAQTTGFVYDGQPRTVSNLIVDETTSNPAAVAKLVEFVEEGLDAHLIDPTGAVIHLVEPFPTAEEIPVLYPDHRIFLQNVATDEGLSAPFSSWMTIFGQFFDHGLDLVEKGGAGTVVVPLAPDDPLYDHPGIDPNARFLTLTRATNHGERDHLNRTTPFIDQNQTYTSHSAHQVFLREYELIDGRPVPTGHLLDNPTAGGLATWADIKNQARDVLGIELDDHDVHAVPLVAADPYGRFIPGANGFPQLVIEATNELVEGDLAAPVDATPAYSAGQAFLDDIAHGASPGVQPHNGALLDIHYVTGDGRGNENVALTAAHHIFHSEHNRLIEQLDAVIAADTRFGLAAHFAGEAGDYWDRPERMFQAARFFNEMQYQHLAVEEFLRAVVPSMDVQPLNESAYHSELNAAITAEFAHVVYRFGHSMLTETLPRYDAADDYIEMSLLDGFLNPAAFTMNGAMTPDEAASGLIRGLAGQVGNGIDEFVTDTLRNNLLGLPLDLATINMARARDVGIPPLNVARARFYAATLDPTLQPYAHWEAFRLELKHRDSIVNFIAAYGTGDAALEGASTTAAKRARAMELVNDQAYMTMPAAQSGLNDVDFWMGGLAERTMVFGGMLGSTFNHVFETQAELLQNADRFYYLTRTQGQNLLSQLEGNSFTELIQRNTTATAMPLDVFTFPSDTFLLDELALQDPSTWPAGLTLQTDGTIRYDGEEHVIMYGTGGDDRMHGGIGDDTIWGLAGDDRIEGDDGADSLLGGDGDDIITDIFGDDTIIGGAGNDAIRSGPGEDLVLSGSGNDFVMLTRDDLNNTFTGVGNDIILGGTGSDRIWAGDGDDWLEGGTGHDLLQGDNAIMFQNDPNGGHDVLIGGPGNNDADSDGGDDVIVAGHGVDRNEGMLGFDWVTYKGHHLPVVADMRFTGLMPPDVAALRDRFDLVEGLSGWNGHDVLRGLMGQDDIVEGGEGHLLTEEHLDRVAGLEPLLRPPGHINYACRFMSGGACALPTADSDGTSNLIFGGGGSDIIEGRAGDDFIDGDVWLDVQLEWVGPNGQREMFDSALQFGDRVISGEISPEDLHIRRSVKAPDTPQDDVIDTAVYTNAGEQYELEHLGDGYWQVFHFGADELEESDGRDILRNIEYLQFPDRCVILPVLADDELGVFTTVDMDDCGAFGAIVFDTESPVEDQPITATVTLTDALDPVDFIFEWQFGEAGEEWEPSPNPSTEAALQLVNGQFVITSTFIPRDAEPANHLRLIVSYVEDGVRRSITSPGTLNPVENVNDVPTGPDIEPNAPHVGDVLTALNLVDNDGIESIVEDQIVTYRWQQSDGAGGWVDIATTAQPFYRVTLAQLGRQIRVIAEYTDDHDMFETPTSAPTAVVEGPAPNNLPGGSVTLSSNQPQVSEELVATNAITDADGIPAGTPANPTFSYQWQRFDGATWSPIPGPSGTVIVPTADLAGQRLRVRVSYTDTRGFAEVVFSDATDPVLAPATPPPPPPPPPPEGFAPLVPARSLDTRSDTALVPAGSTTAVQVAGTGGVPADAEAVVLSVTVTSPAEAGWLTVYPCGEPMPLASSVNHAAGQTIANMVVIQPGVGGEVCLYNSAATELLVDVTGYMPAGSPFDPITPVRIIDTRADAAPVAAGSVTSVALGAPAGSTAASLNLTVVGPSAAGYVTVFPCGEPQPDASNVNFEAGQTIPNAVITKIGAAGDVCVYTSAAIEFIVDLNGSFSGADFTTLNPVRLLDTRAGGASPVIAGSVQVVQIGGAAGVPAGATATAVNVTVTQAQGDGYVTLYPCGVPRPVASNLNYVTGQTIAAAAITGLGASGQLCVYTSESTHLIVDVNGAFTP